MDQPHLFTLNLALINELDWMEISMKTLLICSLILPLTLGGCATPQSDDTSAEETNEYNSSPGRQGDWRGAASSFPKL